MTRLGQLLHAEIPTTRFPTMRVARIGAARAAAMAVAAFVEEATFVIGAGVDGLETPFNLEAMLFKFPRNSELVYPTGSIVEVLGDRQAHNLSPTPMESTLDRYGPGTVLWKTAELVNEWQLDFFVSDDATQEAIRAALPALFNPREDAAGVLLQGPEQYWCLPVRATLLGDPTTTTDSDEGILTGERRLMARVRTEIDEVHLRKGNRLFRPVVRLDVRDPGNG